MDEINKLLEQLESDLRLDGYCDGNVVIQDLKKLQKLALNIGVVSDSRKIPKVVIVGCGSAQLSAAKLLAEKGIDTIAVDIIHSENLGLNKKQI